MQVTAKSIRRLRSVVQSLYLAYAEAFESFKLMQVYRKKCVCVCFQKNFIESLIDIPPLGTSWIQEISSIFAI